VVHGRERAAGLPAAQVARPASARPVRRRLAHRHGAPAGA